MRAIVIADGRGLKPGVARDEEINTIKASLRNHCEHEGGWRWRRVGGHRCENCTVTMPDFIMRCQYCSSMWCKRYTLNRA
jgi:hypothetical protein